MGCNCRQEAHNGVGPTETAIDCAGQERQTTPRAPQPDTTLDQFELQLCSTNDRIGESSDPEGSLGALRQRFDQDSVRLGQDLAQPRDQSAQDQLEVAEVRQQHDLHYPKGARLAVVALSLGLALLVFGLVSRLQADSIATIANSMLIRT